MKSVIVTMWNLSRGEEEKSCLYHGVSREQAIINFVEQFLKNNSNAWKYPKTIKGLYKSKMVKDRILYDYCDENKEYIISAQYA